MAPPPLPSSLASATTWPLTKASAFAARAASPFPPAWVSPHCCSKALPSAARRLDPTFLCGKERTWRRAVVQRRSEEHTSVLQSLMRTSSAVFCLYNKTSVAHQPLPNQSQHPSL